jgi:hypothetical protein
MLPSILPYLPLSNHIIIPHSETLPTEKIVKLAQKLSKCKSTSLPFAQLT